MQIVLQRGPSPVLQTLPAFLPSSLAASLGHRPRRRGGGPDWNACKMEMSANPAAFAKTGREEEEAAVSSEQLGE